MDKQTTHDLIVDGARNLSAVAGMAQAGVQHLDFSEKTSHIYGNETRRQMRGRLRNLENQIYSLLKMVQQFKDDFDLT